MSMVSMPLLPYWPPATVLLQPFVSPSSLSVIKTLIVGVKSHLLLPFLGVPAEMAWNAVSKSWGPVGSKPPGPEAALAPWSTGWPRVSLDLIIWSERRILDSSRMASILPSRTAWRRLYNSLPRAFAAAICANSEPPARKIKTCHKQP